MPTSVLLFATLALAGAAESPARAFSAFADLPLEGGFRLSAVRSSMNPVEVGRVLAVDLDRPAQWRLAQWGTRFSLESVAEQRDDDGARTLSNEGKNVTVHRGGLSGGGVLLAVHGGAEYEGSLRQHGQPWPHLLIEQKFDPAIDLNALDRLDFRVEFRVVRCEPASEEPLDPGLHTAHATAFWTVHNTNRDSADFGDMIWFGVPLFDARHEIPPGHQAVDRGSDDTTGKFICTIEGKRFWSGPVNDGRPHTLACDLLPLLGEALAAAQARGFLTETRFADLAATTFNLGWEVPGPYDCALLLRRLMLRGVRTGE